METVRIGVIGVGNIARNYHLPPVHALPNSELVAVADLDESLRAKAQEQFGFQDSYDDYRRLLDRDDIHAIMLLTRVNTHTEIIPAALEAGKHVFTQKPFALKNEDAELLAQAAKDTGNRLVCSFMHRYFAHTQGARQILREGKIGRLEMVRHRNCIGSTYDNAVRLWGGVLDIGTHGVDVIRYLTEQDVVKVQAMMDPYLTNSDLPIDKSIGRPNETAAIMNFEMSGGTLVTFEMHWTQRGGGGAYYAEHYGDGGSMFIKHPIAPATLAYTQGKKRNWIQPDLEDHPKGHLHHKLFVDDIANDTYNSATPDDALATVKIINAAYRAAQTGETIKL
ncbi:MAG: Gfo/Idh/MocA family oxidoreductase [Candidatus Latescibacteria bacterium]|jgi:predicted dehydrogenase|nr:Gfo/Idh/MocA family oxidoreductase [Candidatus Latescibacterota bacterium]